MKNTSCQSCGMPAKQDLGKGGTKKNGSKTTKYCSYCYQKGKFLHPEVNTPQKMQNMCILMMHKHGMPKWVAWLLTRGIPRLERWKK